MTSDELAKYTEDFISRCASRIRGVGNDQYSHADFYQTFEEMDPLELCDWLSEELEDVANYAAMLSIRLGRFREGMSLLYGGRTRD